MAGLKRHHDGKIAGLYDLDKTLGRGHFAVVRLARHVFTGEKVAVKVIDKTKLDPVARGHLFQEVRCMKMVQHPNVVRLYEVIDTATKLYLILELGDGGDMYDCIMKHDGGLSEDVAKCYFAQIVHAISYCHQLHVVHRDLKPENVVFFEKQGVVKLTDFGFSNRFHPGKKLTTSCGSLAYSAPEILLGEEYDAPAVDIWSLGVILFMLVCGQPPFQEANDSETLTMIMDCKYTVPPHISHACREHRNRGGIGGGVGGPADPLGGRARNGGGIGGPADPLGGRARNRGGISGPVDPLRTMSWNRGGMLADTLGNRIRIRSQEQRQGQIPRRQWRAGQSTWSQEQEPRVRPVAYCWHTEWLEPWRGRLCRRTRASESQRGHDHNQARELAGAVTAGELAEVAGRPVRDRELDLGWRRHTDCFGPWWGRHRRHTRGTGSQQGCHCDKTGEQHLKTAPEQGVRSQRAAFS